jgi:hypothetical protein
MRSFPQNVIKHKVGLLNLATELGNVSRACKVMVFPAIRSTAISRPSSRAVWMP